MFDVWRKKSLSLSRTIIGGVPCSRLCTFNKCIPAGLFQSVKSVSLVGEIQFSLAKSILNGTSPATLNHLCLDLVPDLRIGGSRPRFVPQDKGEKARIIELAVVHWLLTPLTGRFTALRTLRLRTTATYRDHHPWYDAAWEASYVEWASFIGSVKGTVEKFMCEQVVEMQYNQPLCSITPRHEIVNERFQRLVLPTIVSGNWTCLDTIELRGIESSNGQGELAKILKLFLVKMQSLWQRRNRNTFGTSTSHIARFDKSVLKTIRIEP